MGNDNIDTRVREEFASIAQDIPRRFMIVGGRDGAGNWLSGSPGRAITVEDFERIIARYRKKVDLVYNLAMVAYEMNWARGDDKSRQQAQKIMDKYGR